MERAREAESKCNRGWKEALFLHIDISVRVIFMGNVLCAWPPRSGPNSVRAPANPDATRSSNQGSYPRVYGLRSVAISKRASALGMMRVFRNWLRAVLVGHAGLVGLHGIRAHSTPVRLEMKTKPLCVRWWWCLTVGSLVHRSDPCCMWVDLIWR